MTGYYTIVPDADDGDVFATGYYTDAQSAYEAAQESKGFVVSDNALAEVRAEANAEYGEYLDSDTHTVDVLRAMREIKEIIKRDTDPDTDFENAVGNLSDLFCRTGRLPGLMPLLKMLPGKFFWRAMDAVWWECYDTWPHQPSLLRLLNRHAATSEARQDDRKKSLTIYRGCSRRRVRGLSWTTNCNIAAQFANGHLGIPVPHPVIASAVIHRRDVLAYIWSPVNDEHEVIVNPKRLRSVEISKDIPPLRHMD